MEPLRGASQCANAHDGFPRNRAVDVRELSSACQMGGAATRDRSGCLVAQLGDQLPGIDFEDEERLRCTGEVVVGDRKHRGLRRAVDESDFRQVRGLVAVCT